ncbi:helix-turn-helix domain-containing protein, partial [Candidatus Peregrinibacteria bacterium]|nr:helix-turn-helix domain-containing protein [Candidatus Peregrinibacteria bacterium]
MKIQPIGERLKAFRKQHGKTLKSVAEGIQATSSYISQLEHGVRNPSDDVLSNILKKSFNLSENKAALLVRSWRIDQYTPEETHSIKGQAHTTLLPFYTAIDDDLESAKPREMRSFYLAPGEKVSDFFLWEMHDTAMEPNIPQGSVLLACKDTSAIPYHAIVLVTLQGVVSARYY